MGKYVRIDSGVSAKSIGPPERSRSDFFLPPRPAKSLDAAKIRITGAEPRPEGSSAEAQRAKRVVDSLLG